MLQALPRTAFPPQNTAIRSLSERVLRLRVYPTLRHPQPEKSTAAQPPIMIPQKLSAQMSAERRLCPALKTLIGRRNLSHVQDINPDF
jgi:hypothetical protein